MYVCVSLQEESVKEKKGAAVTTAEQEQRSPLQSVPEDTVVPQLSLPTTPEKGRETAGEFPRSPVKEEHSSGVEQLGDQPASSSTLERPQSSVQDVFEPPKPPSRPPSSVGFPSPSKPQKPANYAGEPPPRTMRERQQSESAKRPLAPPTLWSSVADHFLHFYDIGNTQVGLTLLVMPFSKMTAEGVVSYNRLPDQKGPVPAQSILQCRRPQSILQCRRPQSILQCRRPQSILQCRRPQSILQCRRPQSILQCRRPQSILQCRSPQSILQCRRPQSILQCHRPQSIPQCRRPQSILQCRRSQSILQCHRPQSILQCRRPQYILQCRRPQSILQCHRPQSIGT